MRLLVLAPELPYPPRGGARLRNFHLIRRLAQQHEVHLLTFAQPEAAQEGPNPLAEVCATLHILPRPHVTTVQRLRWLALSGQPDLALRLRSPLFHAKMQELLSTFAFNAVQVEGLEMAPYFLEAEGLPPVLFDEHNAEYVLQRRAFAVDAATPTRWKGALYSLMQWRRLVAYERRACRTAKRIVAVSEHDRQALLGLDSSLQVDVVPNGIDCEGYSFRETVPAPSMHTLLFTGVMDFRPNVDAMVWFCRKIMPLLREKAPAVRLVIAGRSPSPAVRSLAAPDATVTGEVEDDALYFREASVYVAPLRMGGGTRFKILQAMAAGAPVVSTRCGAEGIHAEDGKHLLLADSPRAFADAVLRLLREPELTQRLRLAARRLVEDEYDWRVIAPRLLSIYERWDGR